MSMNYGNAMGAQSVFQPGFAGTDVQQVRTQNASGYGFSTGMQPNYGVGVSAGMQGAGGIGAQAIFQPGDGYSNGWCC